MPTVTTRERVNYCHACGAQPGQVCRTVNGRRSDDHAVRVHGIGPALPPSDVHVDTEVCRCQGCHNVRRREARHAARPAREAARAARREAARQALIEADAAERARAAAHPANAAPCYVCAAPIGTACPGRVEPHPERGHYGAWTCRPGRSGRVDLPARPRVSRVVEAPQVALLFPRRPATRRTAA